MEKKSPLPTLKLADNIPVKVRFDGVQGKELFNEQYGTRSYMYIVYDLTDNETKKVWFATEKQHAILLETDIHPSETYILLKHKLPDDKYTQFRVSVGDTAALNTLESYLQDKQQDDSDEMHDIPPEAAAWALKSAVSAYDLFARNHLLPGGENLTIELEDIAYTFLQMQRNIMEKGKHTRKSL